MASAYVLCSYCSYGCPRFQRAEVETKRIETGVILVNIQAKVYSGVSMSLYTEVKAD